jgi:hypothetical protein
MRTAPDDTARASRLGFDAVIGLSQDLLEAHRLEGRGQAAEAAARLAVQRLPGAAQVRVRWHGPQPGSAVPPLVTIFPLGSAAPASGAAWSGLQDFAAALVRAALDGLSADGADPPPRDRADAPR